MTFFCDSLFIIQNEFRLRIYRTVFIEKYNMHNPLASSGVSLSC